MGLHGGAPLVPQHRLEAAGGLHLLRKGAVQLGPGALSAVHVAGEAHDQLLHPVLPHQPGQLRRHRLRLPAVDHRGKPGQQAGGIGDGHPGSGVSVVNRHDAQSNHSFSPPIYPRTGKKTRKNP